MSVIARRIGAVVYEGHVRARTLPDDPALDDLRTEWGEIEYVPAEQLRGAVEALAILNEAMGDVASAEWPDDARTYIARAAAALGGQ